MYAITNMPYSFLNSILSSIYTIAKMFYLLIQPNHYLRVHLLV